MTIHEDVNVITRDCKFAEEMAFSDPAVDAMDEQDIDMVSLHNEAVQRLCAGKPTE